MDRRRRGHPCPSTINHQLSTSDRRELPLKIHEYQAKQLLGRYGVPTPPGEVAATPEAAAQVAARLGGRVAVKAQVHAGGRGKAGGIKVVDGPEAARQAASQILGMQIKGLTVEKVLVEQAI